MTNSSGTTGSVANAAADPSSSSFLRLDHITKSYGNSFNAVSDLSLELEKGKMLALLGPSGCGKTTALRMIAGLLPPTSGTIHVAGTNITNLPPHKRDMGLVFQNYALFPHMSVAKNVAFGLKMRGVSKSSIPDRVIQALELVRMAKYADRKPRELSGGQQQRVSLARALVIEPRLLLLDEPLSNLDAKLRDEMRVEIREIQQRLGITAVLVTHDQVEALTMCDRVAVMNSGQIMQIGSPTEIYENPSSLFVSDFVGRSNAIDCEYAGPDLVRIKETTFRVHTNGETSGPLTATIRPHRIKLTPKRDTELVSSAVNRILGRVERVSYIGDIVEYTIATPVMTLQVESPTSANVVQYAIGEEIMCEWFPQDMHVFRRA